MDKRNLKFTIYAGGLAEEVDEKVLHAAFIPFGELVDIQMPLDYETEKHRGFAFVEFEASEDAMAAIDNLVCLFFVHLGLSLKIILTFRMTLSCLAERSE